MPKATLPETSAPVNGTPDHNGQVFRLLAEQLTDYIKPALDADAVREIVDERFGDVHAEVSRAADTLADQLTAQLDGRIDARIAKSVRVIEVRRPDADAVKIDGAHAQFDDLMQMIREGHQNVLMVGPAGSGKTTLGKHAAEALSLPFGFISLSAGVSESHLLGRVMPQADGSWKYEPSLFVRLYTGGGVFLLDEVDAADANVMVSVNAALANGVLALPNGEVVHRHKDCFILAAANTLGRGANAMYVGRNALDAATLDRFVLATVHVEYDVTMERRIATQIAGDKAELVMAWVTALRTSIESAKLRRVASSRLVISAARAMAAGVTLAAVASRYLRDWSTDELNKVSLNVKEVA